MNFSDPQSRNCGQFHLVLLFDDHVILPKAEKRKIPILVTTRSQNLIKRDFLIHYLRLYVVSCYFCLKIFWQINEPYASHVFFNPILAYLLKCEVLFFNMQFAKAFKTKNYNFWLQKGIKNWFEQLFWTQDEKLMAFWFTVLSERPITCFNQM